MFYSRHPYSGILVEEREPWSLEQCLPVLDKALDRQRLWKAKPVQDRIAAMSGIPKLLDQRKHELALVAGEEMGKPYTQALAEVAKCIRLCNYYFLHASGLLAPRIIQEEDLNAKVLYRPLGVVLGVMPWNFPYWQTLRLAIPSLISGNTVLIKPAPQMLRAADLLEEILNDALPFEGLFHHLFVDHGHLDAVLETGRIHGVSLTGSDQAGSSIATLAGKHLVPSVLELGGSDPLIVFADADLKKAAHTAVMSRMTNNGQTCLAAKRWLVSSEVSRDFLELCSQELDALVDGPPESPESFFSCVAREDLAFNLEAQVQDAITQGAVAHVIYKRATAVPTHVPARILTHVDRSMGVWIEEVFGPVAILSEFDNVDQVVTLANDSKYGLGASVWTKTARTMDLMMESLEVGNLVFNGLLRSDPRMPFGGVKRSGYGRELGPEGLYAFCNLKSVILEP